jgi:hypothetical protein
MTDFFAVSPHELAGVVKCHRPGGVGALGTLRLFAEACRSEIDPRRGAIESCGAAHPVGIVVACRVRLAAPVKVGSVERCREQGHNQQANGAEEGVIYSIRRFESSKI